MLTICAAKATDNVDGVLLYVCALTADGNYKSISTKESGVSESFAGGKLVLDKVGAYTITYVAIDAEGNMSTVTYRINVK